MVGLFSLGGPGECGDFAVTAFFPPAGRNRKYLKAEFHGNRSAVEILGLARISRKADPAQTKACRGVGFEIIGRSLYFERKKAGFT